MPLVQTGKEVLEAIDKFHDFYSDAWGDLIVVISLGFVIVGIVVPVLIQILQSRSFKREAAGLRAEICREREIELSKTRENINTELQKAVEELKQLIEETKKRLEERVEKKIAVVDGAIFHIQGNALLNEGFYAFATRDYVLAVLRYLQGEDELNLHKILELLAENCLPKLTAKDFEAQEGLKGRIEEMLSKLEVTDDYRKYSFSARKVREQLGQALTRVS